MNDIAPSRFCSTCGKEFVIQTVDLWTYKRKRNDKHFYFCSWKCLRAFENKEEKTMHGKVTLEQKKRAVEIALEGGDYLKYLKELGSKQPSALWYSIKKNLETADPEKYERLQAMLGKPQEEEKKPEEKPVIESDLHAAITGKDDAPVTVGDAMKNMADAADEFFGTCNEMGLLKDEPAKITQPVVYDDMVVRDVEGKFGRWRRSDVGSATYIDFENPDNLDVLSFTVEHWRKFREEQEKAFAILWVEL